MTGSSPVTADEVKAVVDYSVHLRSAWRHYQILFEDGELRRTLLHRIAPIFFGDLNKVLIEQLVLQICKLTDPATTGSRKNLTLDCLVDHGDFTGAAAECDRARALRDSIGQFRAKIVVARNKLISHLDRESVMAGIALGGASDAEWEQFWDDLDALLHILHTRFVDPSGYFHLNDVSMISDADSLVKALKESTYFHEGLAAGGITQTLADIADNGEFSQA
jgi:hypothetical protein